MSERLPEFEYDAEPTEQELVNFIRSVEQLDYTLNVLETQPDEESHTFVVDANNAIWPDKIEELVKLGVLEFDDVIAQYHRQPHGGRLATIDATLTDDDHLIIHAQSDSPDVSCTMGSQEFTLSQEDVGKTFASLSLPKADSDDLKIARDLFGQGKQAINPTDPVIFRLLSASATNTYESDISRRYVLVYDEPTEEAPVHVTYSSGSKIDGTKSIELTCSSYKIDSHGTSRSFSVSLTYSTDRNMHLEKRPSITSSLHVSNDLETVVEQSPDNSVALIWMQEVVDRYIQSLRSSANEKPPTTAELP